MSAPGPKTRVAFLTLGCKANRYDTGALMALCPPGLTAIDLAGDASWLAAAKPDQHVDRWFDHADEHVA